MKKPPAKVASSKRRFDFRLLEDTCRNNQHKPESDDRLERKLPYHNPSAPDTWEELDAFFHEITELLNRRENKG